MGSNTYLGGNTVINGGWTWSGKSGLSRPKRKTASQIEKLNRIRRDFLNSVIDAELDNIVIKRIRNKQTIRALGLEIEKAGGIDRWALSQTQYYKLKIIKIKRKKKIPAR